MPEKTDKEHLAEYAAEVARQEWTLRMYLSLLVVAGAAIGVSVWHGTSERRLIVTDLSVTANAGLARIVDDVATTRAATSATSARVGALETAFEASAVQARLLATRQEEFGRRTEQKDAANLARLTRVERSCCSGRSSSLSPTEDPERDVRLRALEEQSRLLSRLFVAQQQQASELTALRKQLEEQLSRLERQEKTGSASYVLKENAQVALIHPPVILKLGKRRGTVETLTVLTNFGAEIASKQVDLRAPAPVVFNVDGYEYQLAPIYVQPRRLFADRLAVTVTRAPAR